MEAIVGHLEDLAMQYAALPMLSRTHGQTASPTTLGKELANVAVRLRRQIGSVTTIKPLGKFNGAVGNFNAHLSAYPDVDWPLISKDFVESLGLEWNPMTTQIEPHDYMAELFQAISRFNTILIDFNRDIWGYISLGYFKQKTIAGEIGSSTMPHKVNPIDFENAEGNLKISNSLLLSIKEKIQISRMQRDLSDSTTLRNLGSALSYSYLAMTSLNQGLAKIQVNREMLSKDLEANWEVLTEAIQTILRKNNVENSYEKVKKLSRGKSFDKNSYLAIIAALDISEKDKTKLSDLTPLKYTGLAEKLAKEI